MLGLFGATLVSLFTAFPKELVAALAGLALLGAIGGSRRGYGSTERPRSSTDHLSGHGVGQVVFGVVGGDRKSVV